MAFCDRCGQFYIGAECPYCHDDPQDQEEEAERAEDHPQSAVKERAQAQAQLENNRTHRKKEGRMKKRHIFLLVILGYFAYSVLSSGLFSRTGSAVDQSYRTDHYTLTLPGEWTCDQYKDNNFTFSYSAPDSSIKDVIIFSETTLPAPLDIDMVRDDLLPEFGKNLEDFSVLEVREITIHQDTAFLATIGCSIDGSANRICLIFYPFENYAVCLACTCYGRSEGYAEQLAQTYAKQITTCLYDIAADEFRNDLMSIQKVASTGYIFVKAQLSGSDSDKMITFFEYDAADFLEKLRKLVKDGDVDFTEVSFQGYTDLVDKYGNVTNKSVFQFWITRETLDKINFEHFNPKNFEAIGTNWYLHPAMTK